MISRLRKRFIAVAMLSVFIVLFVIMGAINLLNYRNVVSSADTVLQILKENGGSFHSFHMEDGANLPPDSMLPPGSEDSDGTDGGPPAFPEGKMPVEPGRWNSFSSSQEDGDGARKDFSSMLHDGPQRNLSAETPFESRYFTVVYDTDGTVASCDTDYIAAVDSESALTYAESVLSSSASSGFTDVYRYLKYTNDDGQTVILFLDCQKSLGNFYTFLYTSILISLIGFAAVFLMVFIVSYRIVKPVQESYDKQRQFITDAGHELKTPLTIIDADVSVLELDIGENEWLDDVKAQTSRLAGLTNDLIYLSRMDEGNSRLQMIDFPLSDLAADTVQSFRSRAQMEEKTFTSTIEPMISYEGDEKSIQKLITILLDNALKYSNEKGTVDFRLKKKGKGVEMTVWNTVTSIDPDTISHMFDRFYRADQSRNSSKGGYGIGLSIASAVAAAHKGRINASTSDGKSLTITVTLP